MKPLYFTKNLFIAQITEPKFVTDKYNTLLGHYEEGGTILSVPVVKKHGLFYNILNEDVYSDDPYNSKNKFTIISVCSFKSDKKVLTSDQAISIYENETKKNFYQIESMNFQINKHLQF